MKRTATTALLVLLAALAGCSGEEQVAQREADLLVAPEALAFGVVFVDEAAEQTFSIHNRSAFLVQVAVEAPAPYAVSPRVLQIPPQAEATVDVVFQPQASGRFDETITVRAHGALHEVAVSGIGTRAEVETVPRLDFGVVGIGQRVTKQLAVKNLAHAPLFIETSIEGPVAALFSAPKTLRIEPLEETAIEVSFTPQAPLANEARLLLRACAGCDAHEVLLVGEGARDALFLDPLAVDFGSVGVGTVASRILWIRNDGSFDLKFLGAEIVGGEAVPFRAELPDVGEVLTARGGAVRLELAFEPPHPGTWETILRVQVGSSVRFVPLVGFAPSTWIVATPPVVDLGAGAPGEELRRTLRLESQAKEDLVIVEVAVEGDAGFGVTHPPLPMELVTPVDLQIRFTGTQVRPWAADLLLRTNKSDEPMRIPLRAIVVTPEPCTLEVPDALAFGAVAPGVSVARTVRLRNTGAGVCSVWNPRIVEDPHGSFSVEPLGAPELVAPGEALDLVVRFAPAAQRLDVEHARLFVNSSAAVPLLDVALSGLAFDVGVEVAPASLDFGAVPVGAAVLRNLDVRARRDGAPSLRTVVVPPPFARADDAMPPGFLTAGTTHSLAFSFTPEAPGPADAVAELHFDRVPAPLLVPLAGAGEDAPCVGACRAPQAICTAAIEAPALSIVRLAGEAAGAAGIVGCTWSVAAAPAGSSAAPEPVAGCDATFRPDVEGAYRLELVVEDAEGQQASCTTELEATAAPPILVEIAWSDPDDVDLHLLHPNAGSPADEASWFDAGWDCFFSNPAPTWESTQARHLGDLRAGKGPEQALIAAPIPGVDYVVGAHWFEASNGNATQEVTTRIHCGGGLVVDRTDVLEHPMQAIVVGSVRVDAAGGCTFTADGRRLTIAP